MDTKEQFKELAINDEEFSDESMQLISEWYKYYGDLYLKSDESKNLSNKEREEAPFVLSCFCDFCYSYFLRKPGQWTPPAVIEVCLNIIPAKVTADINFYKAITPVLVSFMNWAENNALLNDTKELCNILISMDEDIIKASQDSRNWGMAKSFAMSAQNAGIDMSNREELEKFAFLSNEINQKSQKQLSSKPTKKSEKTVNTFDEALEELQKHNGYFPEKALKMVIAEKDKIVPHLLSSLKNVIANYEVLDDAAMLHIYAIFLLAQFREKTAYPLILDILRLPDDYADECFGDAAGGYSMTNIIASVYNGDLNPIFEIIENPKYNEYCRATALDSLLALYATEQIDKKTLVNYFRSLFDGKLPKDNSFVWAILICAVLHSYCDELFDEVKDAFNEGLVDVSIVGLQSLDKTIREGEENTKKFWLYDSHHFISDTVKELKGWACFKEENNYSTDSAFDFDNETLMADEYNTGQTYVRSMPKTGRNDPCPCGSGKKFKKCCLH
ncbi:MAG: DUF1186 domain-containing protein [Gammaproteobacteria bacterium]|jgi:hypothetical protein